MWTNQGSAYFESLASKTSASMKFLTRLDNGTFNTPLTLSGNKVGIGGPTNANYTLTVTGTTYLSDSTITNNNLSSATYIAGPLGTGYSLYKDNGGYTLEIDKLIVRGSNNNSTGYTTQGLDGTLILNYNIIVQDAEFIESIPLYIKASVSGKYTDLVGTIRPLSDRAKNIYVVRTSLATLDTDSPTKEYVKIPLSYAIGDYFDDGSADTTVTYNNDATTGYYTPA